jgi:hypothetical protein
MWRSDFATLRTIFEIIRPSTFRERTGITVGSPNLKHFFVENPVAVVTVKPAPCVGNAAFVGLSVSPNSHEVQCVILPHNDTQKSLLAKTEFLRLESHLCVAVCQF